jgi:MarR family transcriptional regulator for hemolysin
MDYVLRINRVHMRNVSRLLGPKGLLQGEWLVLETIRALGPIGVGDLAREMTMERPTISKMLERMERRKLIARTINGHDRRASPVVITHAGRSKLRNTEGDVRRLIDGCMRGFDARSTAELVRLLALLERNIGSILNEAGRGA